MIYTLGTFTNTDLINFDIVHEPNTDKTLNYTLRGRHGLTKT